MFEPRAALTDSLASRGPHDMVDLTDTAADTDTGKNGCHGGSQLQMQLW
jgi:hypothetical protein